MNNQILVGTDPEVFLRRKSDGALVSAFGHVLGSKENPHPVEKGAVQLDGMAAEFNINPATNPQEFVDNITAVMGQLQDMVGNDYELAAEPVAKFGKHYINKQPEHVKELGCTVDYNAYTGKPNVTPDAEKPFRTGAGHIHIGFTDVEDEMEEGHFNDCRVICALLDAALGAPLALYAKDEKRRELYGDWGAFRPKKYGFEYRVPSNFWLKSPKLMEAVCKQVQDVVSNVLSLRERTIVHVLRDWNKPDQKASQRDIKKAVEDFGHLGVVDFCKKIKGICDEL